MDFLAFRTSAPLLFREVVYMYETCTCTCNRKKADNVQHSSLFEQKKERKKERKKLERKKSKIEKRLLQLKLSSISHCLCLVYDIHIIFMHC